MTTLAAQPLVVPSMPEQKPPLWSGGHFVFENVDWAYYQQTLTALEGTRVRVTYDSGRMELMSPISGLHELWKKVAARLVEFYAYQVKIRIRGYGSATFQHPNLEKGVEHDECYYVQTPPPPPTKELFDVSKAPPPDLAIEVDVTSRSVPRFPIYAAMKVPEVWRLVGTSVTVLLRAEDGRYEPSEKSLAFPKLDMRMFNQFLRMAIEQDELNALEAFSDWIRSTHYP